MYSIAVQKEFIAQHFLIGGDWGDENQPHSHHYVIELIINHDELNQHGYLVDIVDIEEGLDKTVSYFKDKMLNELPEFAGLNPSLEHFCRIIWQQIIRQVKLPDSGKLEIKLWENESCWAAYKEDYVNG